MLSSLVARLSPQQEQERSAGHSGVPRVHAFQMNAQHWVGGETESQRGEEPARSQQQAGSGVGGSGAFSGGLGKDPSTTRWHAVAERGSSPSWPQDGVWAPLDDRAHGPDATPWESQAGDCTSGVSGLWGLGVTPMQDTELWGPPCDPGSHVPAHDREGGRGHPVNRALSRDTAGGCPPGGLLLYPTPAPPSGHPHFCCQRGLAVPPPPPHQH